MRILLYSHAFYPSVGGIETVSLILARRFSAEGHEVRVLTRTQYSVDGLCFPFQVYRQVSLLQLLQLTSWADVVFHNNISLRSAWPLVFLRRPWVVAHHLWLPRGTGRLGWKGRIKRCAVRAATGVAISQEIAADSPAPCIVIANPYDDLTFGQIPGIPRERDLVFVGRLVPTKGADLLLQAVHALMKRGIAANLTLVGAGPEESRLRHLASQLGIKSQVEFVGVKEGTELAGILNRHRVLVVPSLTPEPFGLVALEGIACGCVVVGSEGGGLKDAIGRCGLVFPNGDLDGLTERLAELLTCPPLIEQLRAQAESHLTRHRPEAVAQAYLEVLEQAANHSNPDRR